MSTPTPLIGTEPQTRRPQHMGVVRCIPGGLAGYRGSSCNRSIQLSFTVVVLLRLFMREMTER